MFLCITLECTFDICSKRLMVWASYYRYRPRLLILSNQFHSFGIREICENTIRNSSV